MKGKNGEVNQWMNVQDQLSGIERSTNRLDDQ